MNIIITIKCESGIGDFEFNEQLQIEEALRIINESTDMNLISTDFVYSNRKKRMVSIYQTFENAGIYSGDMMEVRGKN